MRVISRHKLWVIKVEGIAKPHHFSDKATVEVVTFYEIGVMGNDADEVIFTY
jgi:hypothetical protein